MFICPYAPIEMGKNKKLWKTAKWIQKNSPKHDTFIILKYINV